MPHPHAVCIRRRFSIETASCALNVAHSVWSNLAAGAVFDGSRSAAVAERRHTQDRCIGHLQN